MGAVLLLCYASVLWRNRWARQYYQSIRTFLLIPIVKAVMDVGMVAGWFSRQDGEVAR
jgi:hypothetical protein